MNKDQNKFHIQNWIIAILGLALIAIGAMNGSDNNKGEEIKLGASITAISLAKELCETNEELNKVSYVYLKSSEVIKAFVVAYRDKDVKDLSLLVSELQIALEDKFVEDGLTPDVPTTAVLTYIIAKIPEPDSDINMWLDKLSYLAEGLYYASEELNKKQ